MHTVRVGAIPQYLGYGGSTKVLQGQAHEIEAFARFRATREALTFFRATRERATRAVWGLSSQNKSL